MATNTAWGIEVGAYAIKAIRLTREGDEVVVDDFAFIPHKKVLSTPDLDQNEMIRLSLGQFISQKAIEGEMLVMSIPGHAAFARFAKLPPVEIKKVPDIVKFEAVQQIPFPIEEVEWDYQTFTREDSPEIEVGIFAITRERVQQRLALYGELGITPEVLNLSPVAVYNAMGYEHDLQRRKKALIYLDIGTNATDVIVANQGQCWIRTFPLGGTHFTEAIANTFKLSYSKAEKLKREAATSKYARQIMQAMRPVFTDLLQDVQRSLGYYQSVHREVEVKTMVGLGSTFKIPGLRKFLGQQLQMDVVRLDEYRRIRVEGREAASFAENAVNMATAYGLALQGVELGKIDVNLVPVKVLRDSVWHDKIKWFAAAAALAIVGSAVTFIRPLHDQNRLRGEGPAEVAQAIGAGGRLADDFTSKIEQFNRIGYKAENMRRLLDYRTVWPFVVNDVAHALSAANPQSELLGDDLDVLKAFDPAQRNLVDLLLLKGEYSLHESDQDQEEGRRLIKVHMRVFLTHENPTEFLNNTVAKWLRDNAEPTGPRANVPYRILTGPDFPVSVDFEKMVVGDTPDADEEADTGRGRRAHDEQRARRDNRRSGEGQTGGDQGSNSGTGTGIGEQKPKPPGRGRPGPGGGGLPPGEGGPHLSGGGGGAGGGQSPPTGGGQGRDDGGSGRINLPAPPAGGDQPAGQETTIDQLNEMAPAPPRPRLLPPHTRYYETDIIFTIEMLDPTFDPRGDRSARASHDDKEAKS